MHELDKTLEAPLTRPVSDDGSPLWEQINKLFNRARIALPPIWLRDELVSVLSWARYGEACFAAHEASSTSAGVTEEQTPRVTEDWPVYAWVIGGDDTADMNGFIDARIDREGEFTTPLYSRQTLLSALEASRVAPARVTDYWHSVDTAPEDEWVILATSGEHVGQALMLVDEDTGQQAWSWYGGDPVHPNLKPLGWRHMPSPLFTEILPDNRPGGFDGPTGAE